MRKRLHRELRWIRSAVVYSLMATALSSTGCWESDLAKRFREAYAPGFIQGMSTALAQPGQAEAGLRQMGVALAEALGDVIQPRTTVSAGSTGSRSSSSR